MKCHFMDRVPFNIAALSEKKKQTNKQSRIPTPCMAISAFYLLSGHQISRFLHGFKLLKEHRSSN